MSLAIVVLLALAVAGFVLYARCPRS
jgi:hypothetical protein